MPITLQDALERAKLAADPDGILSSALYNQLQDALLEKDRHPFTLSLVDLGIQTRYASKAVSDHMRRVIYDDPEEVTDKTVEAFKSAVKKKAEPYRQSPGGLWVPESYSPRATPRQAPIEDSFKDWQVPDQDYEDISQDVYGVQDSIDTLEENGIKIDQNGMVTFYKANIPGLYSNQIPMKPVPMEQALSIFQQNAKVFDTETGRVKTLQDILSSLNSEFNGLESSMEEVLSEFDSVLTSLEKFKYSEKSPNPQIQTIAEGLTTIRNYISESGPDVDSLRFGIDQHSDVIKDLQNNLDYYYQSQYDMSGQKSGLAEAMKALIELKNSDPEEFKNMIAGMGGISASFKRCKNGLF